MKPKKLSVELFRIIADNTLVHSRYHINHLCLRAIIKTSIVPVCSQSHLLECRDKKGL